MTTSTYSFKPDYAVPPGWVLEEELEAMGLSQAEFARQCNLSVELVAEIIKGHASIETETAIKFGLALGRSTDIWLNMEASYRSKLAELGENEEIADWAKKFPVNELVKRGNLSESSLQADSVARMLSFFDVWSVGTFDEKCGEASVAYRHLPNFKSSRPALATWLRLGEIEAEQTVCPEYDSEAFLGSLQDIRTLSGASSIDVFKEIKSLCLQSGVILLFVKPFPKVALSGASRWLSPKKPVIQLSARHKTDDHLWYSLFHEAGHILLHDNEQVFVDGIRGEVASSESEESQAESQADSWAENFLIPRADWDKFIDTFLNSAGEVKLFAEEQGIVPGIIVGRLQREGVVPWGSRLNGLKRKLQWVESST